MGWRKINGPKEEFHVCNLYQNDCGDKYKNGEIVGADLCCKDGRTDTLIEFQPIDLKGKFHM
jgi:hypothetical protein